MYANINLFVWVFFFLLLKYDPTNGCINWGQATTAAFDVVPFKDGRYSLNILDQYFPHTKKKV